MSKKNLLSESTIRKFMKFANIDGLADSFLREGAYMEEGEHDAMEEGAHDPVEEMAHPMEEGEHDAMEEGAHDALEKAVEAAVDSLLDTLRPFGVEGDVEVDAEDDLDMAPELAGDEGPDDAVVGVDDDEDLDIIDEEEVVNETFNRVTRRLRAMNESRKAEAQRDELADRIASAVAKRLRK